MKKSILKLTNIFHIRCRQREPNSDACGVFLCVLFYIMEILMFHLMKDETAALAESGVHTAYVNCTRGNLKPVSSIYISGVRSSGYRVKPNMAANGGPNLRQSQSPYAVFHVYVYLTSSFILLIRLVG